VLDNEANKLMLEADSHKPLKKNINSVIMKSKKLKASLASYSSSTTSGVYSQKQLTSSPTTRTITLCRDSIL
jgi:hypothetical protein